MIGTGLGPDGVAAALGVDGLGKHTILVGPMAGWARNLGAT